MMSISYKRLQKYFMTIIIIVLAIAAMMLMMAPFIWMASTSFSTVKEAYSLPPRWIPSSFRIKNYAALQESVPVFRYMWNSLKVAFLSTFGQLIFCVTAGYAFARLRFAGRDILFGLLLSSMMIPLQVTIVPVFILLQKLKLYDTHSALILPSLVSAFGVFFMRQFFITFPKELEESAQIDGAGPYRIFWQIYLPQAKPAISALGILSFIFFWNELFRPLIFLQTPELKTLPLMMILLQGAFGQGNIAVTMAGATLAIVPVLIVFILVQRHIIQGITLTGIKG